MNDYEGALNAAIEDYNDATAERRRLDAKIRHLKDTVATLMRLTGKDLPTALGTPGITDSARVYLGYVKRRPGEAVTVKELRHRLEVAGFDFSSYRNANASISGTLQKLVDNGELTKTLVKNEGTSVTGYVPTKKLKSVKFATQLQFAVKDDTQIAGESEKTTEGKQK